LCDAKCGDISGEAAALELIARKMSTYQFKDLPQEKLSVQIKADLHELIRNAVIDDLETELPLFNISD